MNKSFINLIRTTAMMAGFAVLLAGKTAGAATHTVEFGGSFGYTYSPGNFSANVGDTVMWKGDFTMHPLSGLASLFCPSGNDFDSFMVLVPG